jgi:photosystem II stability/assembly factor-like uncharacterized protein
MFSRSTLLALAVFLLAVGPSYAAEPCVADETSLCLLGRFRVSIAYSLKGSPADPLRPARVVSSQGASALFHFTEFGSENWEFLAKGVDLCATANPIYALLVGAATDREYSVEIVDTVTGDRKTFYNPLLNRPILFRTAFGRCGATSAAAVPADDWVNLADVAAAQDSERAARVQHDPSTTVADILAAPATTPAPPTPEPCVPDSSHLCLLSGRFAVQMDYRLQSSEDYRAAEVVPDPSSPDSGLFYYPEFGPENWELLVKGADLCSSDGFFTLIAAAASDRDFRVSVTDGVTGETRRYYNRQGDFPPLFREAFATCDGTVPQPSTAETARQLRASGFGDYLGTQSPSRSEQKGAWENVYFDPAERGAICLDGSSYQASFHRGSTNGLLVYLGGGGACWDYDSCWVFGTASRSAGDAYEGGITDFSNPANPFHDWSILYVPYCDGSVFTGDHVADYRGVQTYHHGLRNLSAAISTAVANLPNPDRIVISGSSAGGYGTFAGYAVSRVAYPDAEILSFNDSGPGLQNPYATDDVAARSANWDFERRFPASCRRCGEQFTFFYEWIFEHDPLARVSLFSYRQDGVISMFLGLGGADYENLLFDVTDQVARRWRGRFARYFELGEGHTILAYDDFYGLRVNDVSLREWTQAFLDDSPGWTDVIQSDPTIPPVFALGELGEVGTSFDNVLLRSEDLGDSWRIVGDQLFESTARLRFFDAKEAVALSGDSFLRTIDGGATWTEEGRASGIAPIDSLEFTFTGGLIFAKEDAAILGQSDYQGYPPYYCRDSSSEIISTADSGLTWTLASLGGGGFISGCVAGDTNAVVLAYPRYSAPCPQAGGLLTTRDRGRTWTRASDHGYSAYPSQELSCTKYGDFWVLGDGTLWHSPDGGETWRDMSPSLPPGVTTDRGGVNFIDPRTGWVQGREKDTYVSLLLATRDGGETWASTPLPDDVESLTFLDERNGLAGNYYGQRPLRVTHDGGKTWSPSALPTGIRAVTLAQLVDGSR